MAPEIIGHCWSCGAALSRLDYGRESRCAHCDKATHCCRNCRHFAPGRANECMEPLVERILDKTRANFCELFEPTTPAQAESDSGKDAEALRNAAESLFK